MRTAAHRLERGVAGSIMVETVLAMPVLLVLITAAIQISHIWMARHIVHYAAFCAARAALVCEAGESVPAAEGESAPGAERAAELATAWIVKGNRPNEQALNIPGWGDIPGSGAYYRKTGLVAPLVQTDCENVTVKVRHNFGMVVFLAGPIIGWLVNPWTPVDPSGSGYEWRKGRDTDLTGNVGQGDWPEHPHIPLTEQVSLPKPYVVVTRTEWPSP